MLDFPVLHYRMKITPYILLHLLLVLQHAALSKMQQ